MRSPRGAELAMQAAGVVRPFHERALLILWPAFAMAGVLEALVFVVVDPLSLHWFGADPLGWSASAVYSVTFLIFWGRDRDLGRDHAVARSAGAGPERLTAARVMRATCGASRGRRRRAGTITP